MRAFVRTVVLALPLVAVAGTALAAAQSKYQQRCLNLLSSRAEAVVRQQGKADRECLRDAQRGRVDQLGDPGETLTAQACLSNDYKGKVALKQQRTVDRDLKYCQGVNTPAFAYVGAAPINVAASTQPRELVADIFGANLDAAVVDLDVDRYGAYCQDEVLYGANRIVADMWRVVRPGVVNALKGRNRRAGAAINLAAHSSENLQGEVLAQSLDDIKGKIQGEVDRLLTKAQLRCSLATTPLSQLFPGMCSSAGSIPALVDCVESLARAHFYRGASGIYGMTIECDLTDNGAHDGSCTSPGQRQHLLDRTGYGQNAWTVARILALGLNGYIDEQLDPGAIDDSAIDAVIASRYPSQSLSVVDVRVCYPQNVDGTCPGHEGGRRSRVWRDMEESESYRAVASRRQLETALVDFWFNHFNVTGSVGQQQWNTPSYLRDSIRPWVLGSFEESVLRMTRGPAMLDYLDQRLNQVGVPPGTGYNENFSRELLELHALGVTGPYTETDVKELARALTGWREEWNNPANFEPGYPGFRYQDSRHDYLGAKLLLGQSINSPGNGKQEGLDAIALVARHPAAAAFLCTKLVRRFVHDDPPYLLVASCTENFIALQDDPDQLAKIMELILKSREFQIFPEYRRSKAKRPVVLMASVLRAVGANPDPSLTNYQPVRQTMASLGERIRNADPPTGYPDASVVWASPGGMVQRFNLLEDWASAYAATWGVSGAAPNADVVDDVIDVLFPLAGVSPATRAAAIAYLDSIAASSTQKVEQAGTFLLSSPEFLAH